MSDHLTKTEFGLHFIVETAGSNYEKANFKYTDDNYGWYTMEGISILHVPGGWTIDFPKPEPLNR